MKFRVLGKTGFKISEVSLGTWQLGGRWGEAFDENTAIATVRKALETGVNFIDTADVYGSGKSENAVGKALKGVKDRIYVATKCGRRLDPHAAEGYTRENIRGFVEDSLKNMGMEALDLIQLHCPPTPVFYKKEVFDALDELKKEGKILNYGVSVETVDEAMKAIEYPNVATVQIIFNMFRQKPAEAFFKEAEKRNVGIIVRVPLASGLLSGKMSVATTFGEKDHRTFNRNGEKFNKGETFSGVDFETGLKAVEELKKLFPAGSSLAQYALRWILMFDAVSCTIPGASSFAQAEANAAASVIPELSKEQMDGVVKIYDKYIKDSVHNLW